MIIFSMTTKETNTLKNYYQNAQSVVNIRKSYFLIGSRLADYITASALPRTNLLSCDSYKNVPNMRPTP